MEFSEGEYVLHSDYAALLAENERIRKLFEATERLTLLDGEYEAAKAGTYNRLNDELQRLLAATQWRPIETAPKDGTVIVAHDWHRGCGIYGHDETQLVSFKDGEWFGKDSYEIHYPTHWMPLPKPPGV